MISSESKEEGSWDGSGVNDDDAETVKKVLFGQRMNEAPRKAAKKKSMKKMKSESRTSGPANGQANHPCNEFDVLHQEVLEDVNGKINHKTSSMTSFD